jgi:hypothetical protein
MKKKSKGKKFFLIFLILLALIFISTLMIMPPVIIKDMVEMHVNHRTVYNAEDFGLSSEIVMLETTDKIKIASYYVKTENPKGTVIFISGIHNPSVTAFFGHAKWFNDLNYDVYLLELRAHGKSEGNLIGLGYHETKDVDVLVKHIKSDSIMSEKPIILYGLSMGGAVAINAAGVNPNINGVISLSAYSSFEDNFADNMILMGMPKFYVSIQKPFVKFYTNFKYGWTFRNHSPKNQIKNLDSIPVLLIHSKEDDQVPVENLERILKNAPKNIIYELKDGNHHMILEDETFLAPWKDEWYSEIILKFFNENFEN